MKAFYSQPHFALTGKQRNF